MTLASRDVTMCKKIWKTREQMASTKVKVESGVQLLARLLKRNDNIENFYTPLFQAGPKYGETIEMFSQISLVPLLTDIICEALVPANLGGPQLSILLFSTDGNMDYNMFLNCLHQKLSCRGHKIDDFKTLLQDTLSNLIIIKIYDATQFYTTIHNIETIMMKHPISLIIFDTITAFYWSEQGYKITKMDLYIKSILQLIQKVVKDYKITLLYTRPEYFSTNKELENLDACSEHPTLDRVNYRIHLLLTNSHNKIYQAIVKKFDTNFTRYFTIINSQINWIEME